MKVYEILRIQAFGDGPLSLNVEIKSFDDMIFWVQIGTDGVAKIPDHEVIFTNENDQFLMSSAEASDVLSYLEPIPDTIEGLTDYCSDNNIELEDQRP